MKTQYFQYMISNRVYSIILPLTITFFLSSCYRQFFKLTTVAGQTTEEQTKKDALKKMLGMKKYVIIHYGASVVHLKNAKIDNERNCLVGQVENLSLQHLNVQKEIFNNMRLRSETRQDILSELNVFISRFEIGPGNNDLMVVPISAIKRMDINQRATVRNVSRNTLITLAYSSVVGAAFVVAACNCPHVMVKGKDSTTFKGTLFPGAIGKTLQRDDHLIMNNIPTDAENKINIRILNELPEIEFIDGVALHEVVNMPYNMLANAQKGLISFKPVDELLSATTPNGSDLSDLLKQKDDLIYNFSEPGNDNELNKVYIKFKNREFKKTPLLVINAKHDKWIEELAEFGFMQLGTKFPLWTKRINKADPEKYSKKTTEKGLSIGIYIKVNKEWKYIGNIENVGTPDYRLKAINIDPALLKGEFIELKLEAAHAFWDVDYVVLSDEWSEDVQTKTLKTISAVDQNNNSAQAAISATDENYLELKEKGNYLDLVFEAPSDPNAILILKGNGYYNHVRNYTHKPNYELLKYMHSNKLAYHQTSRLLYFKDHLVRK